MSAEATENSQITATQHTGLNVKPATEQEYN